MASNILVQKHRFYDLILLTTIIIYILNTGIEITGFASQIASEIILLRIKLTYESQLIAIQRYI